MPEHRSHQDDRHGPRANKNTDNRALSRNRRRPVIENDQYAAFARRIVRAYGRRVGAGDVEALASMVKLADELETAIQQAVIGLRQFGYCWPEIGDRLGISRQAARQRWNTSDTTTPEDGKTPLVLGASGDPILQTGPTDTLPNQQPPTP
jgi:hypothetical protein